MVKETKINPRCFFDITIDGKEEGRIIFELFADVTPKTCENFRALCTGELGSSKLSNRPLHYKLSKFHRVIKGFMCQGGDFTQGSGSGGESIYGLNFPDENFKKKHTSEGLLCMANRGPNTNSSQFYITFRPCSHLDGKHVVFGRVVSGYKTVEKIENVKTDEKDYPLVPVVISNCGELELRKVVKKAPKKEEVKKEESKKESKKSKKDKKDKKKKKSKHAKSDSESDSYSSSGSDSESSSGYDSNSDSSSYSSSSGYSSYSDSSDYSSSSGSESEEDHKKKKKNRKHKKDKKSSSKKDKKSSKKRHRSLSVSGSDHEETEDMKKRKKEEKNETISQDKKESKERRKFIKKRIR